MQKKQRIIIVTFLIIFGIIIFVPFLYNLYTNNPYTNPVFKKEQNNAKNLTEINNFLKIRYKNVIYPEGKKIISAELDKINLSTNPESKLDEIFIWEMRDWLNPKWNDTGFSCFDSACSYAIYNNDIKKLKASPVYDGILYPQKNANGTFYADDPFWIAYHKIGACRELATLFAYMAQQSGIPSRTITSISAGHRFAEVNINGEWKYYDPWCAVEHNYYNSMDGDLTFKDKWYNYPEYFRDNCNKLAYINYYDEAIPNLIATPKYSISYAIHEIKKLI
jgi:hypothetical protein